MAIPSTNVMAGYILPWLIAAMFVFTYYAFVVLTCIQFIIQDQKRLSQAIPYLVFYHIFMFLAASSFTRVIFTNPGYPPQKDLIAMRDKEKASENDISVTTSNRPQMNILASQLPLHYVSDELGQPRWCNHCKSVKPNRTHHDSESNRCILRLDHYCPWVSTAIGARNHKFFVQFCFYAFLFSAYLFGSTLPTVIEISNTHHSPTNYKFAAPIVLLILTAFFTLVLLAFTIMHVRMVVLNRTTIENLDAVGGQPFHITFDESRAPTTGWGVAYSIRGENVWDLGSWFKNWKSIMGPNLINWILPFNSSGDDGLHYEIRQDILERMKRDAREHERSRIGPGGVVYEYKS